MVTLNRVEISRALLLEIVEQKFNDALRAATVSSKRLSGLQTTILYIKFDLRLYALSTPLQLKELWDVFRSKEENVDFIMEVTTELMLRLGVEAFCEVREWIANAYGFMGKIGIMDEDTFYRLPTRITLKDMLVDNPWFITVYLLNTLQLPEDFLTPVFTTESTKS
jgi:hypothetical protein